MSLSSWKLSGKSSYAVYILDNVESWDFTDISDFMKGKNKIFWIRVCNVKLIVQDEIQKTRI